MEVEVSQPFPEEILFENEVGMDTKVNVRYAGNQCFVMDARCLGIVKLIVERRNNSGCLGWSRVICLCKMLWQ